MAKATLGLMEQKLTRIEDSIEEIKKILSLHGLKKEASKNPKEKMRSNKVKATGPRGWLRELVEENFFKQPKLTREH